MELRSQEMRKNAPELDPLRIGTGWKPEDLAKPQVIIESTFGDSHPGSGHLDILVEETLPLIEQVSTMENLRVQGLMTIAPYVDDPEENRWVFQRLRKLSVDISRKNINNVNMCVLSMGMTGDYEVAIEEGATMVRVGTGIFGERNYQL